MRLQLLDWIIIVFTLLICFGPALYYRKRAGQNTAEFFASGRAVPWWLAGLSMVATTFSSDTPNLVTDIVRRNGVAGNWVWWAFTLTGVATVFFYARMWRRSEVLTDLEFYEIRYSGKAAGVVRGFRSVYLGFVFNCVIMATVNLAACKIAAIMFGLNRWETLLVVGALNVVFAAVTGLWGVLVIDMIQFFTMMTAVIAAAYFAVRAVGGLDVMVAKVSAMTGPGGINFLSMLPNFKSNWDLAIAIFIMPLAVQWWAVWYPGAEPGGGSYIAQRMLASKSEKDSLGAVLFFNLAHYVLRPWPWILVALCSLIIFPQLTDIQAAFPNLDPSLLGHDIAYPAMLKFLPVGFLGLMVAGLIAANSSTNLTHLNWGASYLVHDFYRRFIRTDATEKHYVMVGRAGHARALPLRRRARLRPRHGQRLVRHHPPGRGGHGPALPRPLVLVAGQRLVRDQRHDLVVRLLHPPARSAQVRRLRPDPLRPHPDGRRDDDELDADGLPRTTDGQGDARLVLQEGPSVRAGLEGHPQGSGHLGGRGQGHRRQLPGGPRRLGVRFADHLVGPVHGRQRPLRPLGLRRRPLRRVRRERPRPHQGRQPALEQGAGRGEDSGRELIKELRNPR